MNRESDLEKRIAKLEQRVKELEAKLAQPREHHVHYHQPIQQPYIPPPVIQPAPMPSPFSPVYVGDSPYPSSGTITWSGGLYQ